MLQRLQTLWLLVAALCAFLTIRLAFYSGNISLTESAPATYEYLTAAFNLVILIITVAIIAAAVVTIFLYKNRTLQLRLVIAEMALSLLNIFLYYKQTLKFSQGSYSLTAVLTILIPVFLFMAARGINKDQKLIKSLNRLR